MPRYALRASTRGSPVAAALPGADTVRSGSAVDWLPGAPAAHPASRAARKGRRTRDPPGSAQLPATSRQSPNLEVITVIALRPLLLQSAIERTSRCDRPRTPATEHRRRPLTSAFVQQCPARPGEP